MQGPSRGTGSVEFILIPHIGIGGARLPRVDPIVEPLLHPRDGMKDAFAPICGRIRCLVCAPTACPRWSTGDVTRP